MSSKQWSVSSVRTCCGPLGSRRNARDRCRQVRSGGHVRPVWGEACRVQRGQEGHETQEDREDQEGQAGLEIQADLS